MEKSGVGTTGRGVATGTKWVKAKDLTKHPVVDRKALPPTPFGLKNRPAQSINSTKGEEPRGRKTGRNGFKPTWLVSEGKPPCFPVSSLKVTHPSVSALSPECPLVNCLAHT